MMTATVVRSVDDLLGLASDWQQLLARSRADQVFLTWEWMSTWWERYGRGQDLFVVALRGPGGDLVGVAPLTVVRRRYRGIVYRQLQFIGDGDHVCPDHLDFIVDGRWEAGATTRLFECVLRARGEWDVLELEGLRENSLALSAVRGDGGDAAREVEQRDVCPFLTLPATWDAYLASLSPNGRYQVRRRWRRLQRDHGAEMVVWDDPPRLSEAMADLFRLHQARWHGRRDAGSFARDATTRAFHEALARRFMERDWLRLYFLEANGRRVAALLAYQYRGVLSYYQAGFDPEWAPYGVGAALMGEVIRDAIARGLVEFDFLRGQEPFKFRWTGETRQTWTARLWSGTSSARLHHALKRAVRGARRLVTAASGRSGLA